MINLFKLPDDIIKYIINLIDIKCHVCNVQYNLSFYIKLDKYYFCSESCYNSI